MEVNVKVSIRRYEERKLSQIKTGGSSKVILPSNFLIDMENEKNCYQGNKENLSNEVSNKLSDFGQVKLSGEGSLEITKVNGKKLGEVEGIFDEEVLLSKQKFCN